MGPDYGDQSDGILSRWILESEWSTVVVRCQKPECCDSGSRGREVGGPVSLAHKLGGSGDRLLHVPSAVSLYIRVFMWVPNNPVHRDYGIY